MSEIAMTVETIQNSSLGAFSIWQFVVSYHKRSGAGVPIEIIYVVLPVVFNEDMRLVIDGTTSGLLKCRSKLRQNNNESAILRISEAAPMLFGVTSKSIAVAVKCGLISYDYGDCVFLPARKTAPKTTELSPIEREYKRVAIKLGRWLASTNVSEIEILLGVRL